MLQFGDDFGLLPEAFDEGGILSEMGGKDLEGDVTVHRGLVGLVDGGHTAQTDLLDDAVAAQRFAGEVCHFAPPKVVDK